VVNVGAAAPAEGIDFTVLMPPGGRISGRVDTPPVNAQERAVLSGLELADLIEVPVAADGSFTFGHLPKGNYLVSLFPAPPGMPSRAFTVGETDARIDWYGQGCERFAGESSCRSDRFHTRFSTSPRTRVT
jgi:hypothetical protein